MCVRPRDLLCGGQRDGEHLFSSVEASASFSAERPTLQAMGQAAASTSRQERLGRATGRMSREANLQDSLLPKCPRALPVVVPPGVTQGRERTPQRAWHLSTRPRPSSDDKETIGIGQGDNQGWDGGELKAVCQQCHDAT